MRLIAMAIAVALLVLPRSAGEFRKRAVTGLVTDKAGNALPKAAVQLENTRTLAVRSCITGRDGRCRFDNLNDDIDYTLRAKYRNYWSQTKTLSKFNSAANPEIDLVIPID